MLKAEDVTFYVTDKALKTKSSIITITHLPNSEKITKKNRAMLRIDPDQLKKLAVSFLAKTPDREIKALLVELGDSPEINMGDTHGAWQSHQTTASQKNTWALLNKILSSGIRIALDVHYEF